MYIFRRCLFGETAVDMDLSRLTDPKIFIGIWLGYI